MNPREQRALAASVAPLVFGDSLAFAKEPTMKDEPNGAPLRSQPHQDGGQAYGNALNDYLMLMGAEPAADGRGESYLLDAAAILSSLPERLQRALREVHMEQGFDAHGFPYGRHVPTAQGLRHSDSETAVNNSRPTLWRGPLWRPKSAQNGGRPFFRCPTGGGTRVHQHIDYPVAGLPTAERELGLEAALAFRHALLHADNAAPRFLLLPGQALFIDNYRMLHGRERFSGGRKIWRVWLWSKQWLFAQSPSPPWLDDLPGEVAEEVVESVRVGVASAHATQWGSGPGLDPEAKEMHAKQFGLSEQAMDELTIHAFNVHCTRLYGIK
eukprot:SAG31_NODE_5372_length_2580_cov_2.297864_2_plen_326_part_00